MRSIGRLFLCYMTQKRLELSPQAIIEAFFFGDNNKYTQENGVAGDQFVMMRQKKVEGGDACNQLAVVYIFYTAPI